MLSRLGALPASDTALGDRDRIGCCHNRHISVPRAKTIDTGAADGEDELQLSEEVVVGKGGGGGSSSSETVTVTSTDTGTVDIVGLGRRQCHAERPRPHHDQLHLHDHVDPDRPRPHQERRRHTKNDIGMKSDLTLDIKPLEMTVDVKPVVLDLVLHGQRRADPRDPDPQPVPAPHRPDPLWHRGARHDLRGRAGHGDRGPPPPAHGRRGSRSTSSDRAPSRGLPARRRGRSPHPSRPLRATVRERLPDYSVLVESGRTLTLVGAPGPIAAPA